MADQYWPFDGLSELRPRDALFEFLLATQGFLGSLVRDNMSPRGEKLFFKDLRPYVEAAWGEVDIEFKRAAEAVQHLSEETIRLHGLSGAQLRLKLKVIEFFHARYVRFGRRLLKKLLDAIDNLLESIEAALPGAELLSEFKKALEIASQS